MISDTSSNLGTLHLLMPQWQGGDNPAYYLGSQLLAWLSPIRREDMTEVPVEAPGKAALEEQDGIMGKAPLLRQLHAADRLIRDRSPQRISVCGGDCLVDLAPFAYLAEKYGDEFGILWVDAHPDVMTPKEFNHAHAMVLGMLMGVGDRDFLASVPHPVPASRVMYAGLGETLPYETDFIRKHNIAVATAADVTTGSNSIAQWLARTGIRKLAIHLDLDVMDALRFRALLFAKPDATVDEFAGITQGTLSMHDVARLIHETQNIIDVVGMGVTEHLPWDAIALQGLLAGLPLFRETTQA